MIFNISPTPWVFNPAPSATLAAPPTTVQQASERACAARSIRSARQRPLLSVGVRRGPLPFDAYPQRQDKCDVNHIEGYGCGLPGQPCRSQPACWTDEQVEAQAGAESQEGSAGSARSGTREAVLSPEGRSPGF